MSLAVLITAVLAGGSYLSFPETSYAAPKQSKSQGDRAVAVTTGTVESLKVAESLSLVGKLQAEHSVNIAADVAAKVKSIPIPSSGFVEKDQVVVQLNNDKAQAAYDEALAYRNNEQRKLDEFKRLVKRGAITQTEIDAQEEEVVAETEIDQF